MVTTERPLFFDDTDADHYQLTADEAKRPEEKSFSYNHFII